MNSVKHQRLTETQIAIYQREARKTLRGTGYNLFAEITLRLIDHYYNQLAETENLRRLRTERDLEAEFLLQENETLRMRLAELEHERKELAAKVERQQQEINRLKRGRLNMPPSWES